MGNKNWLYEKKKKYFFYKGPGTWETNINETEVRKAFETKFCFAFHKNKNA